LFVFEAAFQAVRVDRFRTSVTRCMWAFLAAGLGFTTTGVHDFLAGHLGPADPMWWGAWLVEPALAGILITLLRWEAEMISRGISPFSSQCAAFGRITSRANLRAACCRAFSSSERPKFMPARLTPRAARFKH
jgi:hypothetical protein